MDNWTRRDGVILQLVAIFVGLVLGALVFVMVRTAWSPGAAIQSWYGLAP